jgi:hypothetical protein
MKIVLIEIGSPTHYSALNGLIKTYSVIPNNDISLFCSRAIKSVIEECNIPSHIQIFILEDFKSVKDFLELAIKSSDRIHFCTVDRAYKYYSKLELNKNKQFVFHVHNIESWFSKDKFYIISHFKSEFFFTPLRALKFLFVESIFNYRYKKMFLQKLFETNYKMLVHSGGQAKFLSQFIDFKNIIVFPFAICEDIDKLRSRKRSGNQKLILAIPGVVTNLRRDYKGLFSLFLTNLPKYASSLEIDLLGYIPEDQKENLILIKALSNGGMNVFYQKFFLKVSDFEKKLYNADVLLNNLNVNIRKETVYGLTKESGIIFNLIRSGIPAIIPDEYEVDPVFKEAVIKYKDMQELKNIIDGLIDGEIELDKYRKYSIKAAEEFTPLKLTSKLIF